VSQVGDWLSYVVVSLLALEHGQGALAVAGVLVAHSLPHVLLAPVGGALADRFDRRSLLVVARLLQAAATAGLLVAALSEDLAAVYVLLLVRTGLGALVLPASSALLPTLVETDELLLSNKLLSGSWSAMFTVGMLLGGALAPLGPAVALGLDVATFLVAAALLASLPPTRQAGSGGPSPVSLPAAMVRTLRNADLSRAVFSKAPLALAGGGAWVLLHLKAEALVGPAAAGLGLGLLQALRGIGTAVGPVLAGSGEGLGGERRGAWTLGELTMFAGAAAFALASAPWALGVAALVWGIGTGANWVISSAAIQRLAPDAILGRASALDFGTMTAMSCTGALGGAWLVDATGVASLAAWGPLAAGLGLWALLRGLTSRPAQAGRGARSTAL